MIRRIATKNLLITVILILVLLATSVVYNQINPQASSKLNNEVRVTQNIIGAVPESTTYRGNVANGTTAFELLRQQAEIEFEGSGESITVTKVNERVADPANREYWAYYINGKRSDTPASQYILQNDDIVEWKIEQY